MSWVSDISKALASLGMRLLRAEPAPEPFGRGHMWTTIYRETPEAPLVSHSTARCTYCLTLATRSNMNDACQGPPTEKRYKPDQGTR